MTGVRRRAAVAATVVALALTAACAGDPDTSLEPWSTSATTGAASAEAGPPPLPTTTRPTTFSLSEDPRAGLPVPSVWRIQVEGETSQGGESIPVDVGGWLLVIYPYDEIGGSLNDINIVDIGIRTDPSPLVGIAGALWFGTNTSIMADLQIPVILSGADVDIVIERRDDDVIRADLIDGLTPLNEFNIYNVESGYDAQIHSLLTGTVSVLFSADGSSITGRIDLGGTSGQGGPTVSSEYHAAITGERHTE